MLSKNKILVFHLVFAAFLVVSGNTYSLSCKNPDVLHFAEIVRPDSDYSSSEFEENTEVFGQIMEEVTGKDVEVIFTKSYADSSLLLQKGKVEFARIGPNNYVQSRKRNPNIEAFATAINKGNEDIGSTGYHSILVISKDSSYKSIAALKNRTLALVDPGSTSGFLVPNILFKDVIGIPLEQYFEQILISGDQILSLKALLAGRVDAAFISSTLLAVAISDGAIEADQFKTLWESPTIPREPFVYQRTLCDELKQQISSTLFQLHNDPRARNWLNRLDALKLVPVKDEAFDIVRQLIDRNSEL